MRGREGEWGRLIPGASDYSAGEGLVCRRQMAGGDPARVVGGREAVAKKALAGSIYGWVDLNMAGSI